MRFSSEQLKVGTRRREAAGDVVRPASKRPCLVVQSELARASAIPSKAAPVGEPRRESPTEAPTKGGSSVGVEAELARNNQSAPAESTRDKPPTTAGPREEATSEAIPEAGGKALPVVEIEDEAPPALSGEITPASATGA